VIHKFNVKNKHKLDNEERRKLLPPHEILIDMGLKEGNVMADIGCGIGYFTFPASEIVGNSGKIFAMDISLEMLEEIEKKIEENNISNITTILTGENDFKIPAKTITVAFISTVLHEIENKEKFLYEVNRVLLNGGRIGIIEWEKIESEFGPPLEHRLSQEYVQHLLEDIGFRNVNTESIGEYFYAITGEK
jgi:ubiquinone/menaquinone biosynthesis C-methylase UbiE